MLLLIASAKKMDFAARAAAPFHTQPAHLAEARTLMGLLRDLDLHDLAGLMAMSDDLAALTAGRCRAWHPPFTPDNARPALLAYAGDVYAALEAATLGPEDLAFAQEHLRILSGLYGLLRPLDLIQPYRLEMAARLGNPRGPDLYAFWRASLTRAVARALAGAGGPLVNLASGEYFSVLDGGALPGRIVTPVFEEPARGGYRVQAIHAKRARGRMARFAIANRLERAEDLLGFDDLGYRFDAVASGPDRWVFRR